MPPISSFFGRWLEKSPFFLLAGTLLLAGKIPPKCCTILVWIAGC
jgi:hypothetical protein